MKSSLNKRKANKPSDKPKATAKQFDEAFDSLATFLFEQYRKYKEEV